MTPTFRRSILAVPPLLFVCFTVFSAWAEEALAEDAVDPKVKVAEPTKTIVVDFASPGCVFEGLGGLSAGASSRLLIDYPEPQRSEILDYLFKPNYGAALPHLKVEIGGDINSTDGAEPSHARTREEFENPRPEYFDRGYEWWLMREAKRRNPSIDLDALQWGTPAWIGDKEVPDVGDPNDLAWKEQAVRNRKKFYTQDNADYIVSFLQGAKRQHGLEIEFCGIWNEVAYDVPWIKLLRKTLNDRGLSQVKIVAADQVMTSNIVDTINQDAALKEAVHTVGVHYPGGVGAGGPPNSSAAAKECGKPLWCSEDGPWRGNWGGSLSVGQTV